MTSEASVGNTHSSPSGRGTSHELGTKQHTFRVYLDRYTWKGDISSKPSHTYAVNSLRILAGVHEADWAECTEHKAGPVPCVQVTAITELTPELVVSYLNLLGFFAEVCNGEGS